MGKEFGVFSLGVKLVAANTVTKIRIALILVLALLSFLTIATHFFVQSSHIGIGNDGAVINIAGRQRMLSQRIAKTSWLLAFAMKSKQPEVIRLQASILDEAMQLWSESHFGLVNRSTEIHLPEMNSGGIHLSGTNSDTVTKQFAALAPSFGKVHADARQLLDLAAEPQQESPEAIAKSQQLAADISEQSEIFLPQMDCIVGQYEWEAANKMLYLEEMGFVLAAVLLGLISLQVVLMLEPLARASWRTASPAIDSMATPTSETANA